MRNAERLDSFYDELKYLHKKYCPDWRFGQVIENVFSAMRDTGKDPFFPEDGEMIQFFEDFFGLDDEARKEMAEAVPSVRTAGCYGSGNGKA